MESFGNEQVAEDITKFMTINNIDLTELKSLKGDNPKNPFLCYLNINSLHYKITDLRYILKQTGIKIIAVSVIVAGSYHRILQKVSGSCAGSCLGCRILLDPRQDPKKSCRTI